RDESAALELSEEDADVAMRIDGDALRQLARAMQPSGVREADFDPACDFSREIARDDRRLVAIRQAGRHLDAFGVLEAVGEEARGHVLHRLRGVLRQPQRPRLVDAAVDVVQFYGYVVDR